MILSDDQIDANLTIGECYLPEEVKYKSFETHDSEQIAGIPEDKTLSDKTAEAISNGLDYSDEDNKYTYQAYFSAYEMNPAVTEES